jgi:sugar phosphate isomerase/epimerase
MLFGGPVFTDTGDPDEYVAAHVRKSYAAAYCPPSLEAGMDDLVRQYRRAFEKYNVLLAEVGIWNNPMSRDPETAKKAFDYAVSRLELAEALNARCCVNVVGTWYDGNWYGPCPENFSEDFFAYAVEVSRKIIDAVKPVHTKMTFELMPYVFLDSPAEYMRFLKALDRPAAGIHFDPTNCINSPRLLYNSAAYFEEAFRLFGGDVLSIHLKDIDLRPDPLSVMLDEVPIGRGRLDYPRFLRLIDATQPRDVPVLLEHLDSPEAYDLAAKALRAFAAEAGVPLGG